MAFPATPNRLKSFNNSLTRETPHQTTGFEVRAPADTCFGEPISVPSTELSYQVRS
jgi:hypothetical protein